MRPSFDHLRFALTDTPEGGGGASGSFVDITGFGHVALIDGSAPRRRRLEASLRRTGIRVTEAETLAEADAAAFHRADVLCFRGARLTGAEQRVLESLKAALPGLMVVVIFDDEQDETLGEDSSRRIDEAAAMSIHTAIIKGNLGRELEC